MKYLILALLLTGCAITSGKPLEDRVKALEYRVLQNDYTADHNFCFTMYSFCKVDNKPDCWKKHEQCVINVYRQYKPLVD